MNNKIYVVSEPYSSKSLKKTYNKQLEVNVYEYSVEKFAYITTAAYVYKNNSLNDVGSPRIYNTLSTTIRIYDDVSVCYSGVGTNRLLVFSSLELAWDAKLLLIKHHQIWHDKELKKLKRLMLNNYIGLDEIIQGAVERHAELFI